MNTFAFFPHKHKKSTSKVTIMCLNSNKYLFSILWEILLWNLTASYKVLISTDSSWIRIYIKGSLCKQKYISELCNKNIEDFRCTSAPNLCRLQPPDAFGHIWTVCLCGSVTSVSGLCIWCGISPTRLSGCSLGFADVCLSETGLLAAPSEWKHKQIVWRSTFGGEAKHPPLV